MMMTCVDRSPDKYQYVNINLVIVKCSSHRCISEMHKQSLHLNMYNTNFPILWTLSSVKFQVTYYVSELGPTRGRVYLQGIGKARMASPPLMS